MEANNSIRLCISYAVRYQCFRFTSHDHRIPVLIKSFVSHIYLFPWFHRNLSFSVSNSYNKKMPYNSKISLLSLTLRWEHWTIVCWPLRVVRSHASLLAGYWVFNTLHRIFLVMLYVPQLKIINNSCHSHKLNVDARCKREESSEIWNLLLLVTILCKFV